MFPTLLIFNNQTLSFVLCTGQPRRHLLTTGWSVFVSAKRLQAGDSVLFIRYIERRVLVTVIG